MRERHLSGFTNIGTAILGFGFGLYLATAWYVATIVTLVGLAVTLWAIFWPAASSIDPRDWEATANG